MKAVCLFFLASILLPLGLCGQVADLVKPEGIKTTLHQNNLGRVFFTPKYIPISALKEADFLQSYTLTNKSNLFFTSFLGNSLTNYLHRLQPDLTADSLVKIGNYQFTLLIDGKQIYQSNLWPGAPQARMQDTAMVLNRPLVDNENGGGSWSESFWNRFLYNGGEATLSDGKHLLRMEIRPYVNSAELKVGEIIAAGDLALEVLRHPKIDVSTVSLTKVMPYNGLPVSKELFDQNKIKELKGNIDQGVFKKISSVVVIKNGKLLIEEYFNGKNRNSLHDTRSVGKSFASTMCGIAIRDGYLKDENQTLKDFYQLKSFANFSLPKENTSIRELLTMSSGFAGNDNDDQSPGNEENMYPTSDWVKFALDLPFDLNKPKGEWSYFTAGVVLLGDILNKQVKGGLEAYATERLFKPLGISNYQWQYTPQQVPNTAGGIQMNALDFAKYGLLYKNGGVWNKQQIIPKAWVDKSFSKQKQIPERDREFYGYLFWNKSFKVNGKAYEAFYCAGNGGNYILVFKDLPLVIVVTATAYGMPYAHPQVAKMLSEYILPAVLK
ncbi:MAG: serine hydrolase [Haliscomenobacter sp.]|uniref:serine hydrolase domain-containing protein n=1 Tax=Haliscomenobacter sp. TaxID=2717303 RepID=UPI0029B6B24A|nr:serine hydrolase [Haliscomenobacter sp.]MDX2068821.1 serine hydrolase [Haliscomenobacter sp.]